MRARLGLSERLTRRLYVWPLLALPALYIAFQWTADQLSYGETIHLTGQWSVGLLCAVLLTSPIKHLFPRWLGSRLLLRHRRAIGVASFGYALLHTVIYLVKKWPAGLVLQEGLDPSLLTGWIAFLLFLALAVSSNNISVKKLGRHWKTLHRSVYIAAAVTFTHWALTSFNPSTAMAIAITLCLVELTRIRRKKTNS